MIDRGSCVAGVVENHRSDVHDFGIRAEAHADASDEWPSAEQPARPAVQHGGHGTSPDNRTRALTAAEAKRFLRRAGPADGAHPQTRLRRLLSATANGQLPAPEAPAVSLGVPELTLSPELLVEVLSTIGFDMAAKEALLRQHVVPIHVSDVDGTLWMEPIADALVYDTLAAGGLLKPDSRQQLSHLMAEMGLQPSGLDRPDRGVNRDVLRVKEAFDLRRQSYGPEELAYWSRRVYPVTTWALAGFTASEVRRMTREVIEAKGLDGLAFVGAREKLAAIRATGIPTVLFSASNDILAQAAIDAIFGESPPLEVIGTRLHRTEDDVLTANLDGEVCFAEAKLQKVRIFLREFVAQNYPQWLGRLDFNRLRTLLASGDSPSSTDEHMLKNSVLAWVDEPGTHRDTQVVVNNTREGHAYFFIDYLRTVGGAVADKFDVREYAPEPAER